MKIQYVLTLIGGIYGFFLANACSYQVTLERGMVINRSVSVRPGTYVLGASDSMSSPVLTIEGNDIVVDFNGAEVIGDDRRTRQDLFEGLGIVVQEGSNITIRNLSIRGFKVGLLAKDVDHLVIENSDFSYNYRPRLKSIREREDLSDWLSYHNNESDEWFRYGAGLYLKDCDFAVVRSNTASQNQNALLMVGCDSSMVYNNVFTFNSGLGIGMYRCSDNKIMHNCLDFNVRGYSHGIYQRGQDSAGLLVYEQCMRNEFSHNSATHSGDGFFLWAGQHTMDTGEGGCNDNLIAYNDFSYAPTNGIEVTFSANIIHHNKLEECRYGIWAGYSHHTDIRYNDFSNNEFGVAFEHGNNNTIAFNMFNGDETGIKLWEREQQPADWGFSQKRDVSSRNYHLYRNEFVDVKRPFDIESTAEVDSTREVPEMTVSATQLDDGMDAKGLMQQTGRDKIMVNEWGPYNFEYPLLWLYEKDSMRHHFRILGPRGTWSLGEVTGFQDIDKKSGNMNEILTAIRSDESDLLRIEMLFSGKDFQDQFGRLIKGNNVPFSFTRYDKKMTWQVGWYSYDEAHHPLSGNISYERLFTEKPHWRKEVNDLAFTWWRSPGGQVDPDRFITLAKTSSNFEKGKYEIEITSDDGLRFYIDDNLMIDHWDIHVPETDKVTVDLDGNHEFRVVHFEGGGFATLSFNIRKVSFADR